MRSLVRIFSVFAVALVLAMPGFAQMPPGTPRTTVSVPQPQIPREFTGSATQEKATAEDIPLTMADAIDRSLKYNLGVLLTNQDIRAARGQRLQELSSLLPQATGEVAERIQKINLAAFGFTPPPGSPSVVGPFSIFDARTRVTQEVFNWRDVNRVRSAQQQIEAARYSYADAREIVVLVASNLYLRTLADQARQQAAQAQLDTALDVVRQTNDLKQAGVVAAIDVLRARVEEQAGRQRLVATANDFQKSKIALARAIGLPIQQKFHLVDAMPYVPLPPIDVETEVQQAFQQRADYKQQEALLEAAQRSKTAAEAGLYPTLEFDGDYGGIGQTPGQVRGTFTAAGVLKIPLFQGGKVRAEVMQAEATVRQRQAQLDDLRGRIEEEVRTAFLDIKASEQQVEAARAELGLAQEQLTQARDRFSAGVGTSLDVSQAEEAVASAHENYISSLYANNIAKAELARAAGSAEKSAKTILGIK